MGRSKKPSRKKDIQKARSLLQRYKEHQEKVQSEPNSFTVQHGYKEKENFMNQSKFYHERAGVDSDDVV